GVPFSKWRSSARGDLVAICDSQARANVQEFAHHSPATVDRPFVLSGHQPTLFHPGVWLKNYLLSAIAEKSDATPINLIIDSDIVSAPGIMVPAGPKHDPSLVQVPIDIPDEATPWEWRPVRDIGLFTSFARRVKETYTFHPSAAGPLLLDRLWEHAIQADRKSTRLNSSHSQI